MLQRNLTGTADAGKKADQYDSCYYIIETPKLKYKEGKINVTILKQDNMELSVLSGNDFKTSTDGKVAYEIVGEKDTLSVEVDQVMVLIVRPELNQESTAFEFEYTLTDQIELESEEAFSTAADEWYWRLYKENFTDENGQKVFIIVCTCLGLLICLFFCCICYCSYYCCCKPKVIEDEQGRRFSRRRSTKGSSIGATMRRSMRLESIVSRSG